MNHRCLGLLLACVSLCVAPAFAAEDVEIARLATQVCANCHGPHGDSISSAFPRLAGQNAAYVEAQLKAFKDQTRGDPYAQAYMWGMASQLEQDTMKRLAAYYAAEKPNPGRPGDPARMALGKRIFDSGLPDSGIPPCTSCHLEGAQGKGGNTPAGRAASRVSRQATRGVQVHATRQRPGDARRDRQDDSRSDARDCGIRGFEVNVTKSSFRDSMHFEATPHPLPGA